MWLKNTARGNPTLNNRMTSLTLKPCLFCGQNAHLEHFNGEESVMFQVKCDNSQCEAETIATADAAEAYSLWNNRNGGDVDYD